MNPTTERVNVMEKKNWMAMPMVRVYNIVVELFIDETRHHSPSRPREKPTWMVQTNAASETMKMTSSVVFT